MSDGSVLFPNLGDSRDWRVEGILAVIDNSFDYLDFAEVIELRISTCEVN